MPTFRFALAFVAAFSFCQPIFSQEKDLPGCGFDGMRPPAVQKQIDQFEKGLAGFVSQKKESSGPMMLPCVVHIIHNGGAENISDAQVLAAIEHLNDAFAAAGFFAQKGATVNTQIQFCLAKRDPDGNATTGITRDQSPLTEMVMETDDLPVKNLNRWKPTDYVNIWVVKDITSNSIGPGVAGYAYFPSSHGSAVDGMVCEARYFGTSPSENGVLIHEMGHYCGLYHTFEGGCKNDDCSADGDRVCDTPPDQAKHTGCSYNSCSTDVAASSPFTSDVDDFTGDFMDYSPFTCYYFFTSGQAERMQAAVGAARASLLASMGCADPCTMPVAAGFTAVPNPVMAGQPVVLTNSSTGGTKWEWSENGSVISNNKNETRTFSAVGQHEIVLKTTNQDPNCADTALLSIKVLCPLTVDFSASNLNPAVGEAVNFTSTTTGGATSFEWSVNGIPVGTSTNLTYSFSNPGLHAVNLLVVGPFCTVEKTVWVDVKSSCGLTPEPMQVTFTAQLNKKFLTQDIEAIGGGYLLHVGSQNEKPMVTLFDAGGNVVWHKLLNVAGSFYEIEPLPDGDGWLLFGHLGTGAFHTISASDILLAKIDFNGNFVWSKQLTISGKFQYIGDGSTLTAANPDGSFGLLAEPFNGGRYLMKLGPNGQLLWSKKLTTDSGSSFYTGIRRSADGAGDFLLVFRPGPSPAPLAASRIRQDGSVVWAKQYRFPADSIPGSGYLHLATHEADGGFSIFYSASSVNSPAGKSFKVLSRFAADGSVKWVKKFVPSGGLSTYFSVFSSLSGGKGWLVVDGKVNTNFSVQNNYVQHVSDDGEVLWQRKFGGQGFFGETSLRVGLDKGRLRFIREENYPNKANMHLMALPDANLPIACLPDVPVTETTAPLSLSVENISLTTTNTTAIIVSDFMPTFVGDPLIRTLACDFVFPCPEICGNQLDDDDDGLVDCFDTADCPCPTGQDTACAITPPKLPIRGKIEWESSDVAVPNISSPAVANLNPQTDAIAEILVPTQFFDTLLIYRGDGANLASPDRLQVATLATATDAFPLIIDIDRDGSPEVLYGTGTGKIKVFRKYQPGAVPPMELWFESNPAVNDRATRMSAADFDGDGVPEIHIGAQIFTFDFSNPVAPTLSPKLKGTGHVGKAQTSPYDYTGFYDCSQAVDMLSVADCNGDPDCAGLELVAGANIYSVDLDPNDGDGLQIKIQRDLNQMVSGQGFEDGYTQVADLNLDGRPDVVVAGPRKTGNTTTPGFYAWDRNGLIAFVASPIYQPPALGKLTIANVFDDRKMGFPTDLPEVVSQWYGFDAKLVAWNLNAAAANPADPYWWKAPSSDMSAYSVAPAFDFDRDGFDEIVLKGESSLRVHYGGPDPLPTGVDPATRAWFSIPSLCNTAFDGPAVADVDGDGAAEIATVWMDDYFGQGRGRLRVIGSDNLPWPPARPIWNQYNFFNVNINDDLTVPKTQQKHWLEMGGIGSGKRPFNTHLAASPSLNPLIVSKLPVPDASLTVDSVRCQPDSFEVFLTICNFGSAVLPAHLPVSFYKGDPTSTAAPLHFPPVFWEKKLEEGDCQPFHLTIPAAYGQKVFVVANDDGSTPRPFVLTKDTISTGQPECHLTNNIGNFFLQNSTPPLDLGPDKALCQNSVVKLSAGPLFKKYRWQDGSADSTFTAFGAGKYWVDAFDACGFKQTDTILIKLNTAASLDLPPVLNLCPGGSVDIAASPVFSEYKWSPASVLSCTTCPKPTFLGSGPTTVSVTARTGNCFLNDSVQVKFFQEPTVEIATTNGDCGNPATLSATASGSPNFQFSWSNSETGATVNTTQSGTYVVTATDGNGCTVTSSASVSITNSLSLSSILEDPKCHDGTDGSIHLTASGGGGNVKFSWSNGATGANLPGLQAGSYAVTATSASGCTFAQNLTLNEPPAIAFSESHLNATCPGKPDGSANVATSGGSGILSIIWSTGATGPAVGGLAAGIFGFTVTDAAGCSSSGFAEIQAIDVEPPVLKLKPATVPIDANGKAAMTLALFDDGSTDNCGIENWTISPPNFDCSQLGPQTVNLTATDAVGNSTSQQIEVEIIDNKPPTLTCPADQSAWWCNPVVAYAAPVAIDNCIDDGGGQFALVSGLPSGSNFPTGQTVNQWTYTDAGGNIGSCAFTVTVHEKPLVDFGGQQPLCHGDCTGEAVAAVTGGVGPFQFLWENGQTTAAAVMLCAGTHLVTVTDGGGCQTVESISLGEPDSLTINVLSKKDDLGGAGIGSIEVAVAGGMPGYTFEWRKDGVAFSTVQNLTGLKTGSYFLKVTDMNGCEAFTTSIFIDNLIAATEPEWADGLVLRPNPTPGSVEIYFQKEVVDGTAVEVFDATGRLVGSFNFERPGRVVELDLSGLPTGFYELKINLEGRAAVRKLVRL